MLRFIAGTYTVNFANRVRHNHSRIRAIYYSISEREQKAEDEAIMIQEYEKYLAENIVDKKFMKDEQGTKLVYTDSGQWEEVIE